MEYSLIRQGKDQLHEIRQSFVQSLNRSQANIILDVNDFWHQGLLTFPH
jgi:hypothetical protein